MEKLAGNEDGVWIEGMKDAITPIQDAPLDAGVVRNIPLSKDDLREISGTSGDQRGIPESETATQANLIQLSANIRENYSRMDVSRWLCHIGRLLLITLRQNAALPIWIKHNVDELSPGAAQEEPIIEELWRQIQAEDLGNVIHDVQLDPTELSPLGEELERNNFFQGLSILSNPQFGAILLGSPLLLRKALRYFRITNARDIAEIQNALLMGQMLAAASVSAQGGSPGGGPPAQGDLLPASAPGQGRDNSQIAMQIAKQLSGGQVQ